VSAAAPALSRCLDHARFGIVVNIRIHRFYEYEYTLAHGPHLWAFPRVAVHRRPAFPHNTPSFETSGNPRFSSHTALLLLSANFAPGYHIKPLTWHAVRTGWAFWRPV
jgi:hypothetical protein